MTGAGWRAAGAWRLPVLDERLCTGCRDCVRVCPTACLAVDRGRAWLPRPADCVSCGACVFVCPATAVAIAGFDRESRPSAQS